MQDFNSDACIAELVRLGWTVNVTSSSAGTSWKLTAVRGEQSWLYIGPDLQSVWEAARQMAAINGVAK